jgi:hypothetical protein
MNRPGVLVALSVLLLCSAGASLLLLIFDDYPVLTGQVIVDAYDPETGRLRAVHPTPAGLMLRAVIATIGTVYGLRFWKRAGELSGLQGKT